MRIRYAIQTRSGRFLGHYMEGRRSPTPDIDAAELWNDYAMAAAFREGRGKVVRVVVTRKAVAIDPSTKKKGVRA
jgi:hypothetical protein